MITQLKLARAIPKKTKNEAIFLNSDFSLVTSTEMEPNVNNFKRKQK